MTGSQEPYEFPNSKIVSYLTPGSDEWRKNITASKVPTILGASPWQTAFGLWAEMSGIVEPEYQDTQATRRGTHLENGVAEWYAEENDVQLFAPATYQHPKYPWAYANPDRGMILSDGTITALEVKTSRTWDGWGEPGSQFIPQHYIFQTIWQAFVLGIEGVHVTALGPFLDRRDYYIPAPDDLKSEVLDHVNQFREAVENGDMPLIIDPVRDYSTLIQATPVEKQTADVTAQYWQYAELKEREKTTKQELENIRAEMMIAGSNAEQLTINDGTVVANRKTKSFHFLPVKKQ